MGYFEPAFEENASQVQIVQYQESNPMDSVFVCLSDGYPEQKTLPKLCR